MMAEFNNGQELTDFVRQSFETELAKRSSLIDFTRDGDVYKNQETNGMFTGFMLGFMVADKLERTREREE